MRLIVPLISDTIVDAVLLTVRGDNLDWPSRSGLSPTRFLKRIVYKFLTKITKKAPFISLVMARDIFSVKNDFNSFAEHLFKLGSRQAIWFLFAAKIFIMAMVPCGTIAWHARCRKLHRDFSSCSLTITSTPYKEMITNRRQYHTRLQRIANSCCDLVLSGCHVSGMRQTWRTNIRVPYLLAGID